MYNYVDGDPVNASDPTGRFPFYEHLVAAFAAGVAAGKGVGPSAVFAWQVMMADWRPDTQSPDPEHAAEHCMIGVSGLVPETEEQGAQRYRDYVSKQLEVGDLPGVAHAMMDCRSVYHSNRVWYGTEARPVRSWAHAIDEAVLYPTKAQDLGMATLDVLLLLREVERASGLEGSSYAVPQEVCSQGVCFDAIPFP